MEGYIFGDWALCSGIHKETGACKVFILLDARESLSRSNWVFYYIYVEALV